MQVETVTREPLSLVGLEVRASNADPQPIGALWGRFMQEALADRIEGRADENLVAVYCEYEGDHTQPYTFFLGCAVTADANVPDGFVRREVPGGRFAHVPAHGPQPATLIETWQTIWASPIARRYTADYEVHGGADPARVDIFVGVSDD